MRALNCVVSLVLLCAAVSLTAQSPVRQPKTVPAAPPAAESPGPGVARLPVRRVILYKNGVGYFEHEGRVRGNQDVAIDFTSAQLNDVLTSLTVVDLGGGKVAGVRYNSMAPVSRRLSALRLPVGENTTRADFLAALRGARVEIRGGAGAGVGRLLAVERRQITGPKGEIIDVTDATIVSDAGELRTFELTPATSVRLLDRELNSDVAQYLSVIGSARERDLRRMVISTVGNGERDLFLSYISEVPVWKSTYRVILPDKPDGKATLQGWAVVDNTVGEDWKNVQLSLVSGAPQSFVQEISQPYYARRPTVGLPEAYSATPQAFEGTMGRAGGGIGAGVGGGVGAAFTPGAAGLHGTVTDATGAVIPGARITLRNEASGTSQSTMADARGYYVFSNVPAGNSMLTVEAPGFQRYQLSNMFLGVGRSNEINAQLNVASSSEMVMVTAAPPSVNTQSAMLSAAVENLHAEATSRDVGDLMVYDLQQKITIGKNESALVPIVQSKIEAERVTVWTEDKLPSPSGDSDDDDEGGNDSKPSEGGAALRALWLTNTTGETLDGGSVNVLEGETFAGEGLFAPIKPGEKRLLSYAVDQGVRVVTAIDNDKNRPVTRVHIAGGEMRITRELRQTVTYTVRDADKEARSVIIEHPVRQGWKLADDLKPEETSASYLRFRLNVAPDSTGTLTVRKKRPLEDTVALTNVTGDDVALYVKGKMLDSATEEAFRRIVKQRNEVARIDAELRSTQQKIDAIVSDQNRLRENMKALKGSAEEKALLQRYTKQLESQEDQLDSLRRSVSDLHAQRDKAAAELNLMAQEVTLDLTM